MSRRVRIERARADRFGSSSAFDAFLGTIAFVIDDPAAVSAGRSSYAFGKFIQHGNVVRGVDCNACRRFDLVPGEAVAQSAP